MIRKRRKKESPLLRVPQDLLHRILHARVFFFSKCKHDIFIVFFFFFVIVRFFYRYEVLPRRGAKPVILRSETRPFLGCRENEYKQIIGPHQPISVVRSDDDDCRRCCLPATGRPRNRRSRRCRSAAGTSRTCRGP